MKRFWVTLLLLMATVQLWAQSAALRDTTPPPYKLYNDLPAFNIRKMDSFSVFNTFNIAKGQPTLIVLFDPDCGHCKDVTRAIVRGMDSLKGLQMYFITAAPSVIKQKAFFDAFHLGDYPNVKLLGRDYELFFLDYFRIRHVPSLALFDDKKQFVHLFEGGATVADIYQKAFTIK